MHGFEHFIYTVEAKLTGRSTTDPALVCLAVFPSIFGMIKELPSNIDGGKNETLSDKALSGKGIQMSARKNAALGLAKQQPELWVKEWGDIAT